MAEKIPLITDDSIVFGLLMLALALIFILNQKKQAFGINFTK